MHIVNSITVNAEGGNVTLNFSKPVTSLADTEKFCFKIPCGVYIPSGIDGYLVMANYNGTGIDVLNKYGNALTVGQLVKRKVIKGYYGATNSHIITNELPVTFNCGCNNVL